MLLKINKNKMELISRLNSFFSDLQPDVPKGFEYMYGIRGLFALLVVYSHMCKYYGLGLNYSNSTTIYMAILVLSVFFLQSAFLLTLKTLTEMHKIRSDDQKNYKRLMCHIVCVYFSRRFFRLYLPYVILCTAIKFGPKFMGGIYMYTNDGSYAPWINLVLLQHTGSNHLWTVAVEARYYFFIPLFCFIFSRFKRFSNFLLIGSILLSALFLFLTVQLSRDELEYYFFLSKFPVFFLGSVVSVVYFRFQVRVRLSSAAQSLPDGKPATTSSRSMRLSLKSVIDTQQFKFIMGLVFLFLFGYGFRVFSAINDGTGRYSQDLNVVGFHMVFLFLSVVLGTPNFVTKAFSENYLFMLAGKFSLGIYLFHPHCMLVKVFYYDELTKSGVSFTGLEMGLCTLLLAYLIGFGFYFLVENPSMRLCSIAVDRINARFGVQKSNLSVIDRD